MSNERVFYSGFLVIVLFQGFIWLRSGVGKILSGTFPNGLGTILEKFASSNPNIWYKDLLQNIAVPNSKLIGNMVMFSEVLTGLLLVCLAGYLLIRPQGQKLPKMLLLLGLIIGFFLNLNFWLASGWTSPSSDGLNLLMMVVEIVGIVVVLKF